MTCFLIYMGQSIQEWTRPSNIFGRQPLKNFNGYGLLKLRGFLDILLRLRVTQEVLQLPFHFPPSKHCFWTY